MSNLQSGFNLALTGKFTANNTTLTSQLVLTGGNETFPSILPTKDLILISPATYVSGNTALCTVDRLYATGFSVLSNVANVNQFNYYVLRNNNTI
jgi:hypothetical protein